MAFAIRSLALLASVPVAEARSWKIYTYATDDAAATVLAAGYFNAARAKLAVNDRIDVCAVHNGVGDLLTLKVLTVPASTDVTVAVNTDASGA